MHSTNFFLNSHSDFEMKWQRQGINLLNKAFQQCLKLEVIFSKSYSSNLISLEKIVLRKIRLVFDFFWPLVECGFFYSNLGWTLPSTTCKVKIKSLSLFKASKHNILEHSPAWTTILQGQVLSEVCHLVANLWLSKSLMFFNISIQKQGFLKIKIW